jgi:hypothetical protein
MPNTTKQAQQPPTLPQCHVIDVYVPQVFNK